MHDSTDAPIVLRLVETALAQGRIGEAATLLKSAVNANPEDDEIRYSFARFLQQQGNAADAIQQLRSLTRPGRSNHSVQILEASLLGLLGRYEEQADVYRKLVEKHSSNVQLWLGLAEALKYLGKSKAAISAFRRSVTIEPTFGDGWWGLANMKTFRFGRGDIARMERALIAMSPLQSAAMHFALGKAYEDLCEYEQSFRHYAEGNRLHAATFSPAQLRCERYTLHVDGAITAFNRQFFEAHKDSGHPTSAPIFIIGMQRSGSTLIEQILASHPLIEGTSELDAMLDAWTGLTQAAMKNERGVWEEIRRLSNQELYEIGANYTERAAPFRTTDRPFFVDKRPANWMYVGLIRLALPNATIIDARRHPMASGFSNFKQHYAAGAPFAYSLTSMGHYYAEYIRLMDHFDIVQPGKVHRVLHEALVEQPEQEVRRLLDFVGLPYDDACLKFYRNPRIVRSASAEQVRRPINADGLDQWRYFEPWLTPLREALGEALENWDRCSTEEETR
jgi:tetratricopeptide (TPR) repeat protein